MSKKLKKLLIRILVSIPLFLLLFIGEKTGLFQRISGTWPKPWDQAPAFALAVATYLFIGYDVLLRAGKNIIHGRVFDENFLMMLATFGAFFIGEYEEAVAVMIFYQAGEWFQGYAVGKSRASVADLMAIAPEFANMETENGLIEVDPDEVEIGSIFVVKPGERIPLDGIVREGESLLDTSSLTGESMPRAVHPGESVFSGAVNTSGVLRIEATECYENSTVSRILELVENASERKAPVEQFITRFARIYTPVVTIAAVLLAVIPPMFTGWNFAEWIRRACSFLVISCPCALVISVPLSFFGGIGAASRLGVLVKGSNYLEALSRVKTVAFDKTGTLTKGVFTVTGLHTAEGVSEAELLETAAIAEAYSDHPIARAIREKAGQCSCEGGYAVEERSGKGVVAKKDGTVILAGNRKLLTEEGVSHEGCNAAGTVVYVAKNGQYLGTVVISDVVKDGAKDAIAEMRRFGVERTVMLTGDREEAAVHVAGEVEVDEVKAELLPADKIRELETLMAEKGPVAFVGDGINDAPVLMRSDVGLAMGALGSDAAIEAADIVLMDDDLKKIAGTVRISRKTLRIVWENIVFALGVKFVVLCLGALGLASMWLAMFADVGVAVIAILNAMRTLRAAKSRS